MKNAIGMFVRKIAEWEKTVVLKHHHIAALVISHALVVALVIGAFSWVRYTPSSADVTVTVSTARELADAIHNMRPGADPDRINAVYLANDITLEDELRIALDEGVMQVEIRGGGHALTQVGDAPTVSVGGGMGAVSLTLYDVGITHRAGAVGTGISVKRGGTVTLRGGGVYGNTAAVGGGVHVGEGGAFYAYDDARIYANAAVNNGSASGGVGGGVYVAPSAILHLVGGEVSDNVAELEGGGVAVEGEAYFEGAAAPVQIGGNSVTSDDGAGGGVCVGKRGSAVSNARLTVSNAEIFENSAANGGGVYNAAVLYLGGNSAAPTQCAVRGNRAYNGGGVYNAGTLRIGHYLTGAAPEISGNEADMGGGLYNAGDTRLSMGAVHGNAAALKGAGVYNEKEFFLYPNPDAQKLEEQGIYENIAAEGEKLDGGGVYNAGTLKMYAGAIRDNEAARGGGVYNARKGLFVMSGAITGNHADDGAGIYAYNYSGLAIEEGTAILFDANVPSTVYSPHADDIVRLYAFDGEIARLSADTTPFNNADINYQGVPILITYAPGDAADAAVTVAMPEEEETESAHGYVIPVKAPVWPGHVFEGWLLTDGAAVGATIGETIFHPGDKIVPELAVMLTAQWR